jgi:hypothetical protein
MAELEHGKPVSLEELMVSTLAMTDALAKLVVSRTYLRENRNLRDGRSAQGRYPATGE